MNFELKTSNSSLQIIYNHLYSTKLLIVILLKNFLKAL